MNQPNQRLTRNVPALDLSGSQEVQRDMQVDSRKSEAYGVCYRPSKSNTAISSHDERENSEEEELGEREYVLPVHAVARKGTSGTTAANTTTKKGTKLYKTSLRKAAERSAKRLTVKQLRLVKYQKMSSAAFSRVWVAKSGAIGSDIHTPEFQQTSLLIVKEMGAISTAILQCLKTPIAWCLVVVGFILLLGTAMPVIQRAFQPFCIIPGISGSAICSTLGSNVAITGIKVPKQAEIATMVDKQGEMFEHLLKAGTGGSALSLEIKKAEMATKDFIVLVKISDLECKDILAPALDEFASDARATGRGLQKLAAKVGGAVDNILAVNEFALQSIEDARVNEPAPWSLTSVTPWKPQGISNAVVAKMFDETMNVLSANLKRLLIEAEYSRTNLMDLEEKLATLHEIVAHDDATISRDKSELLEHLWTRLGGNRKLLRDFDHHLALLKGLNTYRKQALIHVVAALETLHAISEDMEDMRERVAEPNLLGSDIPMEVHMKILRMGMERLREEGSKSRRLEKNALQRTLLAY